MMQNCSSFVSVIMSANIQIKIKQANKILNYYFFALKKKSFSQNTLFYF